MINRLIIFTINTGGLTSTFAIITAIAVSNVVSHLHIDGADFAI